MLLIAIDNLYLMCFIDKISGRILLTPDKNNLGLL